MEAVAPHRRWNTSGSGSQYSFRTSVSSLMDMGDEIMEVTHAGGEVAEASQAAHDKVFVAVAEEFKRGKSALQWALQNLAKDGAHVVVAHVHRPAQMIPMMGAKVHYTKMNTDQVKEHRKYELEKALGKLDEYVVLCTRLKRSFGDLMEDPLDCILGSSDSNMENLDDNPPKRTATILRRKDLRARKRRHRHHHRHATL